MYSKKVIINNEVGLHARPAALFVRVANKFLSQINIESKGRKVNGKSIMGVMSLGAFQGEEIIITARGEDEKEAVEALVELLSKKLEDI
ncbi:MULTISPECIES: HPr family phosphocarrier protein [Tissierellales]|jgi:phosphocarrier protein|uniref:Phosphocarrier protein HPr n=1 Tax=Acidilutibacter cellobiosedens TaxID=2507161 RepID=A0A410QAN7_9FIRM|nr:MULTISPECIES: HPr family phosphocarrier protein [Tissierellales]MBE6081443.1 HPr family phosphocarrier protein [Tissierellaceae bacterium]QAT60934.1 HPr family phosphocarrier protein [Acidilutibacter cellobiosedens]SCL90922.1 Phosphocarrier protein HPr [Sporanaerobacter sp. PP17-6a]